MAIQVESHDGETVQPKKVAPMTSEQRDEIFKKDVKDITSLESTLVLVQGNDQDRKEFIKKIAVALKDQKLDPQKRASLESWKQNLEILSLPKVQAQEQIRAVSDATANSVNQQVLGQGVLDAFDKSGLLNLPDNEDGLRQFRNLFATVDTLLSSGVTADQLTKKTLKQVGYDKQGMILDDKELDSIKSILRASTGMSEAGRAVIRRMADRSNDDQLIASIQKPQDGKKSFLGRMKSIFSPNIRGNGALTKLEQNINNVQESENDASSILSDLSGGDGSNLSNELRSFVSEGQLQREFLLSGLSADQIFQHVVGRSRSQNNISDQQAFKDALEEKISLIGSLTGGKLDAGLSQIVNGKAEEFGAKLLVGLGEAAGANNKKITLKNNPSTWTTIKNGLAMGASIAVAIGTKGEVTVYGSETNFDKKFQEKPEKLDADKNYWDKFKDGATKVLTTLHIDDAAQILGDLITGEIGTIKIDDDKLTESMLANFKARMEKYNSLNADNYNKTPNTEIPEVKMLLSVKKEATYTEVRNALISNALFQAVQQNTGVDHSFRIGPLFTGYHRESVSQEFTAGSLDGTAAQVERGMTKIDLTTEQITKLGISAKKKDDKFVYTVPEQISLDKLKHIQVIIDNSSLVGNNWTQEFDTPQTIALQINNAHDKVVARIVFADAQDSSTVPAMEAKTESLITPLEHITIIRDMIQGKLLNHSSVEIRTKYASLQKNILGATNSGDDKQLQSAIDGVKQAFNIGIDTSFMGKDYQIAALNMVLGELAGDGRLRAIRLIQKEKQIPQEQLKKGSDLYRAVVTMVDTKTGRLHTEAQFRDLAKENPPTKLLALVQSVDMKTAHQMLDKSAQVLQSSGDNVSNEQYTKTSMENLGVNWEKLKSVRDAYHTADTGKVFEDTSRYANALGFMVNHQVLVKDNKIQQTTFEGLSGIGPEDQIRTGEPQKLADGDVDTSKFIDKLTQSQIDRLQPAFNKVFGDKADIRTLLKSQKDSLRISFSYAEYPNCTNACILMNIDYRNPDTGVVISMIASQASEIASAKNMGTELGAGGNTVAHELNKDKPKEPEPKKEQPQQTTDTGAHEVSGPTINTQPTTTVTDVVNGVNGTPVVAPSGNTLIYTGTNPLAATNTLSQAATTGATNSTSVLSSQLPPGV